MKAVVFFWSLLTTWLALVWSAPPSFAQLKSPPAYAYETSPVTLNAEGTPPASVDRGTAQPSPSDADGATSSPRDGSDDEDEDEDLDEVRATAGLFPAPETPALPPPAGALRAASGYPPTPEQPPRHLPRL